MTFFPFRANFKSIVMRIAQRFIGTGSVSNGRRLGRLSTAIDEETSLDVFQKFLEIPQKSYAQP